MSFSIVEKSGTDNWNKFLLNNNKANIFQTPGMYEVYHKTKNYEPIFLSVENDDKEIQGVLLAVIQKEHSGFLGKFSARSIIWGGPLVKDDNPEVLDFLLKEYKHKIKGKTIYSQFRNLWDCSVVEKEVFVKHGFHYEPYSECQAPHPHNPRNSRNDV